MDGLEEIPCVLIHYVASGEDIWIPAAEYRSNPASGTFIVRDNRRRKLNGGESGKDHG